MYKFPILPVMDLPSGSHPWDHLLNIRRNFNIACTFVCNDRDPAPHKFNDATLIRPPGDSRALTLRECVTLDDVIAFRDETTRLMMNYKRPMDESFLPLGLEDLSLNKKHFRVIYRYTDIIKDDDTLAILEAIHFEIFMPDRPDLRFIALPVALLPDDSCEGDYYEVHSLIYTPNVFMMHSDVGFWLQWTVIRFDRMEQGKAVLDYILVTEKFEDKSHDRKAVCNWTTKFIKARQRRFRQTDEERTMDVQRIYDATILDTSSAWIYPVEPPHNRDEYARMVEKVRTWSHFAGTFAQKISVLSKRDQSLIDDRLNEFNEFSKDMQMAEQHMIRLFKLGVRFRQLATPKTKECVFVQSFDPPKLQVYTEMFYLDAVTLHFDDHSLKLTVDNIKRECDGKRKKTFIYCESNPDFINVLGQREPNFWIDATLHGNGDSASEMLLERIDREIIQQENGDKSSNLLIGKEIPKMIQAVYGESIVKDDYPVREGYAVLKSDGQLLKLNSCQTKALEIYHTIENSGYCILSPPGSGKTTVAAAMAASLVRHKEANRQGSVQLLLAVQNVAVENLALALKSFDDGTLKSYRLLSKVRTDPSDPMPYGIFEQFPHYKKWMVNADEFEIQDIEYFFQVEEVWKRSQELAHLTPQQIEESHTLYTETLFKAKATLEKYIRPEIILSTVDMVLFKLLHGGERGLRGQFSNVDRIIIDEASLLTESAFFCLARCFPKASFVLIGDDKQLPPFMYDRRVLGHRLAGKAALGVAMRRENMHVIKLVEVYRAPQSLVQPYNNLSYDGTLVSRKKESCHPLADVGLVPRNRPDLLLIDIPKGHQNGSPSPFNQMEIDVLLKLLTLFPKATHDDIMIICVYREQKTRLQRILGPDYEILTVDSSQGKEKPIVIVLTTRTDTMSDYFSNHNRCTVAVSRQQQSLIILGNDSLLSSRLPWSKVLEDFTRIQPDLIRKLKRNRRKALTKAQFPHLNMIDFPSLNGTTPISKQPSPKPHQVHHPSNSWSIMKASPINGPNIPSNSRVRNHYPLPPSEALRCMCMYCNQCRVIPIVNGRPLVPQPSPPMHYYNGYGQLSTHSFHQQTMPSYPYQPMADPHPQYISRYPFPNYPSTPFGQYGPRY